MAKKLSEIANGIKERSAEIAVRPTKEDTSVESFIHQAITANVPVETLEKLFALREKVKAEKAKEEYVRALAVFQGECPVIKKTKKVMNKDGRTVRYQFAPLDSIVEQIKTPLAKAMLSYRWETKNENNQITAICIVTHVLGHSESSDFGVPIDSEGYMTAPQKVASALTFAKRYSLCNALGISTGDEDTDATDVGKEKDAKSDKAKIVFLLRTLGEKHSTKEEIAEAASRISKLDLKDENLGEIVTRLEVLVKERNQHEDTEIH